MITSSVHPLVHGWVDRVVPIAEKTMAFYYVSYTMDYFSTWYRHLRSVMDSEQMAYNVDSLSINFQKDGTFEFYCAVTFEF